MYKRQVKDRYISKKRISLLDADCLNYCQLRYVISNCTIFMGARTHAVFLLTVLVYPPLLLDIALKVEVLLKICNFLKILLLMVFRCV